MTTKQRFRAARADTAEARRVAGRAEARAKALRKDELERHLDALADRFRTPWRGREFSEWIAEIRALGGDL